MCLVALVSNSMAQDVEWGTFDKGRSENVHSVTQTSKGVYCFFNSWLGAFKINIYSLNLTFDREVEIQTDKDYIFESSLLLNNKLYFIFHVDNKNKREQMLAWLFNEDTKQLDGTPILLEDLENKKGFLVASKALLYPTVASDTSHLAVVGVLGHDINDLQTLSFVVYDKSMDRIWNKKVLTDYKMSGKYLVIKNCLVDKQGGLHVLGKVYKSGLQVRDPSLDIYDYILITCKNATSEPEFTLLDLGSFFVPDMQLTVDQSNNPICIGFYRDRSNIRIKGLMYIKMDTDKNEIMLNNDMEFSENQLQEVGKYTKKGVIQYDKDGISPDFELKSFVHKTDGTMIVVAEDAFTNTNFKNPTLRNRTVFTTPDVQNPIYRHHKLLTVSVSKEGDINWVRAIDKNQYTEQGGEYYGSFFSAFINDSLYLFYNVDGDEYTKNKESNLSLNYLPSSKYIILLASIVDKDGGFVTKEIFASKKGGEVQTYTVSYVSSQITPNKIIVFTSKKAGMRLARMTIK